MTAVKLPSYSFWSKRRTPPGAPPGTLITDPEASVTVIRAIAYGPDGYVEHEIENLSALHPLLETWPVTWVNIDGLADIEIIQEFGEIFGLHRLALEDIVNLHQRSKVDDYGSYLFVITRMVSLAEQLQTEQMSIFLGKNFVLTFQDSVPGDCLEPVRTRIRQGVGAPGRWGPTTWFTHLSMPSSTTTFPSLKRLVNG